MRLTRRQLLASACLLRTPMLVWVGGKRRWTPVLWRPRAGDIVRIGGDLQARVVLGYGWHNTLSRCVLHSEDWATWCRKEFWGTGYVLPSVQYGRRSVDVVGAVYGLKNWPGKVRRLPVPVDYSWACVPYSVRISRAR